MFLAGYKKSVGILTVVIFLSACSHNPPLVSKENSFNLAFGELPNDMGDQLPEDKTPWQSVEKSMLEYTEANSDWWLSFQSSELNTLIEQALASSPDLLMAQQRIIQAEAQLGITRANALPHIDASGSLGVSRVSDSSSSGSTSETRKSTSLGVSTSYEVDLWGRVSAEREASEATLESKVYDWHSTRLTLTAAVASSWFEWLMLGEQLNNARWSLQAAEKQLNFIQASYNSGGATAIELAQQRKQVLSRSTNLKKLSHQRNQIRNALAILLGEAPQKFYPPETHLLSLNIPSPDPGLPVDILVRRPDLAREEALLKVANANVKEVRAAIYPSLSLQASARLASDSLSLADPTRTFSIGADIIQSIFDFGERSRRIELTEAKQKEMLLSYYQTVLTALAEVEDALSNEQLMQELETQQQKLIKENNLISKNTEYLYNAGAETLANLLDAQLDELQAKDVLFELYQQRLNASLTLYKVLGGGWTLEQ